MGSSVKTVACKDAGVDCALVIADKDEAEVIALAQDHAKRKHGVDVTPDQVKAIMKDAPCGCK